MNNHIIIILIIILISLSLIFSIWFFEFKCTTNCKNKKCGDDDGCNGKCQTGKCNSNMECKGGVCTELCQPDCQGYVCGMDPKCGTQKCGSCNGNCVKGQCQTSNNTNKNDTNNNLKCGAYNFSCENNEECSINGDCINKPGSGYYIQSSNKQFYVKVQNNEGFLVESIEDATFFTVKEIDSFGYEVLDNSIFVPDQNKTLNLIIDTSTFTDGRKEHNLLCIDNLNFIYLNVNDGPGKICSTANKDNVCTQQKSSWDINNAQCLKIQK